MNPPERVARPFEEPAYPRWLLWLFPDLWRLSKNAYLQAIHFHPPVAKIRAIKYRTAFWAHFILWMALGFFLLSDPEGDWPYSWSEHLVPCIVLLPLLPPWLSRNCSRASKRLDCLSNPDMAMIPVTGLEYVEMYLGLIADLLVGSVLLWFAAMAALPLLCVALIDSPTPLEWLAIGLLPLAWLGLGRHLMRIAVSIALEQLYNWCVGQWVLRAPWKSPKIRTVLAAIILVPLIFAGMFLLFWAILSHIPSNLAMDYREAPLLVILASEMILAFLDPFRSSARLRFHAMAQWMDRAIPLVIQARQKDSITHEEIASLRAYYKSIAHEMKLAARNPRIASAPALKPPGNLAA